MRLAREEHVKQLEVNLQDPNIKDKSGIQLQLDTFNPKIVDANPDPAPG